MRFVVHDTDALSDPKVQRLLSRHGAASLALFWAMVEAMCRDERPVDPEDVSAIAYQLHMGDAECSEMLAAMVSIGLLEDTDEGFSSARAMREVEHYKDVSEKRRKAINKRWGKNS